MGELPQWLMRREKSPLAAYRAVMRRECFCFLMLILMRTNCADTYWWLHRYGSGVRWPNGMHFIQGIILATFAVGLLRNPLYSESTSTFALFHTPFTCSQSQEGTLSLVIVMQYRTSM